MDWFAWTKFDYDPTHWLSAVIRVAGRAWNRTQNRNAALYTGGVCFYALLAVFPALAILIGIYSLSFTADQAAAQAEAFARLMPPGPRALFAEEMERLAHAPIRVVSVQSAVAVLIAFYGSHRGVKALLAGLHLIHDVGKPPGIVGFNILALAVALSGFAMAALISSALMAVRVAATTFDIEPFVGLSWMISEWTWAGLGLMIGLALLYRFAMSDRRVVWSATFAGALTATFLSLFSSWFGAYYVRQIAHLGATYGSITAVVVFLLWVSWNVNAIFYGGAVATEMEILAGRKRTSAQRKAARERQARMASQRET